MDLDSQQAFDWLIMTWVFKVLECKGVDKRVIRMLCRLYGDNFTRVLVNNV